MPASMTVLKCRLHPILLEVEAELQEIRKRIVIVCVDGQPFRALGCGVDGVKADGDLAFQVAADCVQHQAEPLPGFPVLGTVIIMPCTFGVRPVGLQGVSPTVGKEVEVIRHHAGGRFETKHWHSLLPEVRWTAPLLHVGGEMMMVLSQMGLLAVGIQIDDMQFSQLTPFASKRRVSLASLVEPGGIFRCLFMRK